MDKISTPFASLMRSFSKLDTLLRGDRENKERHREKERDYHGESKIGGIYK
jgi:hypothetical protein